MIETKTQGKELKWKQSAFVTETEGDEQTRKAHPGHPFEFPKGMSELNAHCPCAWRYAFKTTTIQGVFLTVRK